MVPPFSRRPGGYRAIPAGSIGLFLALMIALVLGTLISGLSPGAGIATDMTHLEAIAFTGGETTDADIYLMDTEGNVLQNVTTQPLDDRGGWWSWDGARLAFVSDRDGSDTLYVENFDGSEPTTIAAVPDLDWSWSPDGRFIAWVSHSQVPDLWVTDVITGSTVNLTEGAIEVSGPTWSPDGLSIMFASSSDLGGRDISVLPAAGGSAITLTADRAADDFAPQWSPDGSHIAFVGRDDPDVLYVMDADGGKRLAIAEYDPGDALCPGGFSSLAWSPDGSTIAFAARGSSCSPHSEFVEFFTVPQNGGEVTSLASGSSWRAGGPTWSPDGTRISIETGGVLHQSVTLVDPDGTDRVVIDVPLGGDSRSPNWSPDGSQLAFVLDPDVNHAFERPPSAFDIYVVDKDGANPTYLTDGEAPAWRPLPAAGVGLVDTTTGQWHIQGERSFYFGIPGDVPVVGDWDCDGQETPGMFREANGFAYLRDTVDTGIAHIEFFFGIGGDIPLAGDWNGDGCDSLGIYRPNMGKVFLRNTLDTGLATTEYFFGIPGDRPFVGDFDGDGDDEIGLYRESTGFTYLRLTHSSGIADLEFFFGDPADRIIAGDWNTDGRETVGVYRPADGKFYLRNENSQGFADREFWLGRGEWLPVAGEFTG